MNSAETRAQVLYNAILISILILYGLFGAYVFRTLETQNVASLENSQPEISREGLLKELWNQNNLGFDDWSAKVTGKLDSYEKRLSLDTSSPAEWSLADSWLFACTVFTTIGRNIFQSDHLIIRYLSTNFSLHISIFNNPKI